MTFSSTTNSCVTKIAHRQLGRNVYANSGNENLLNFAIYWHLIIYKRQNAARKIKMPSVNDSFLFSTLTLNMYILVLAWAV